MGYFKQKLRRSRQQHAQDAAAGALPDGLTDWLAAARSAPKRPRYVRLAIRKCHDQSLQPMGIFQAAYELASNGDLDERDRALLRELLAYFEKELSVHSPSSGRAIFWFRTDARPFIGRAWELVRLLRRYGMEARMCVTDSPGRIVYQDDYQVAAVMPWRMRIQ